MRHLTFYNSFSFYRPARLVHNELPQLAAELAKYRKEAAENINKKESEQKKPTFSLAQLRQLREKFEAEYRGAGSLSEEKVREKMKIIDEKLRLPEAYVLNLEKASAEIEKVTQDELLAEVGLDVGLQLKVEDRAKYHQEIENWIRENIPDFEDTNTDEAWYVNKTRQALHGFLLGARLTMSDAEFVNLQKTVKDKYERFQTGSRFDWKHFESLKLFEDNTDNAGHARDWWLYSGTNGLKSIGLELVGYEDEGYLTALLMSAEKYFNKVIGGDAEEGLGEQFYQAYKAHMMGVLVKHKSELQKLHGITTETAYSAVVSLLGFTGEQWLGTDYDYYLKYKENYEAQMKIIHENIPTPQEWFGALKAGQSAMEKPEKPGPLQPPAPAPAGGPGETAPPLSPPTPGAGPGGAGGVEAPSGTPERSSESWDGVDSLLKECWTNVLFPYTLRLSLMAWSIPFAHLVLKKPELTQFPKNDQLLSIWGEAMKHKPREFGDPESAGKLMKEARLEFKTGMIALLKEFQTEMPKLYEAVKDKLTDVQRTQLEPILKKLADFNFDSFEFKPENYSVLSEFATLYYELMKVDAAPTGTATAGTAGGGTTPAGESGAGETGGDTDDEEDEAPAASAPGSPGGASGNGTASGSGSSGSGKPPEKPEEGPTADEMRKEATKYCTLDKYYCVTFSSDKAEKAIRLHDRFLPENGNVLVVIPAGDIGKAKIVRFDSGDGRYEYDDGKPAKFLKGYQVLQGWDPMEIVRRYEAALTYDMPREIDAAAKYVGKRYQQLKDATATGLDAGVALTLLETIMARLDRLLKNAKRDSFRLDLVPNFSVEWKNPGAGGERRQGYKLEDVARVGYVFGVEKPRETSAGAVGAGAGGDAGVSGSSGDGSDGMTLPSLERTDEGAADGAPERAENVSEGLPENEKSRLQEAFFVALKNFVRLAKEAVAAEDDKVFYRKKLEIHAVLEKFEKNLEATLKKYHQDSVELSTPKLDEKYGGIQPTEKITFKVDDRTSYSSRDFAYYAGMINDSKKDTLFYKFIERVERYMDKFKEE